MAESVPPAGWLVEEELLPAGMVRLRFAYMNGAAREVTVKVGVRAGTTDAYLAHLAYSPPPGPTKA